MQSPDASDLAMSFPSAVSPVPTVEVVVISWQGMGDSSRRIAARVEGMANVSLRVIYSNAAEAQEDGPGLWQQVPNTKFFGLKFAAALQDCVSDVLLIIQADALFADWSRIVERCQTRFGQRPKLGLWAPRINYTPWTPERVDVRLVGDQGLTAVAQTDGVVLGLSRPVMERLRRLDYGCNNLGWGIDWIAICYCYMHGLEVLREDDQTVIHPPSRGYGWHDAVLQWRGFMRQMDDQEQIILQVLLRYTAERRRGIIGKLLNSMARRRAVREAARFQCHSVQPAVRVQGKLGANGRP